MKKKTVAVITGASRGIGKSVLALLRKRGDVAISVSRKQSNTRLSRHCDVANEDSVKRCFQSILKDYGRIDVLVNSAGVAATGKALELDHKHWQQILDVNLIGSYFCCKYVLPAMVRQRHGKIINISSKAGRAYSISASLAYTCSKYGVIGLTRQLAAEFASKNININCVCPSQVNTEMLKENVSKAVRQEMAARSPMGRFAEPEDVAELIAFLSSDATSYINGSIIDIHGAKI